MTSITSHDLEAAKQLYLTTVPELLELRDKATEKSKILSKQKTIFKRYMKQQSLSSLTVGETTFSLEEEEKVTCSLDKVEAFFPDDLVTQFKNSNKKRRMTFKELRD
jgi:hypothetical protein